MIALLAYSSLLTLVFPGPLTFAMCQASFLIFVGIRLRSGHRMSERAFYWSIAALIAVIFGTLVAGQTPPLDECIKALNYSLAFLVVRENDAWEMLTVSRKFIVVSALFTFANYIIPLPFSGLIGHEYPNITLFGMPSNSGLFFEMNYAAMVSGLVILTVRRDSIKIGLALIINVIYTFRTGFVLIPMILANRFKFAKSGVVWLIAASIWILALLFALKAGPLLLEQRYYIWSAFIELYSPLEIYSKHEMAQQIYYRMSESPWGPMSNLHSGVFEHFAYRGAISGVVLILAFIVAFLRVKGRDRVPLLYVFCLSFIMSLGVGGLNFLALFATFLLTGILVAPIKQSQTVVGQEYRLARENGLANLKHQI